LGEIDLACTSIAAVRVRATCTAAIHSIRLLQAVRAGFLHTLFSVERPEQFPLASATEHPAVSELVVTGIINPDVSRPVPIHLPSYRPGGRQSPLSPIRRLQTTNGSKGIPGESLV
jgi:hypothetical protein